MNVLAYDPFVPAERFHRARSRARRQPRQDLQRGRLHHRPSAQEQRDPRLHRRRGVRQDEGRRAGRQRGARRHHRRRGLGARHRERQGRRLGRRRVPEGADHRRARCSSTTSVVSTPHLGASTEEAQLRASTIIAEQVAAALNGEFATNAVNVPLSLGEDADELMPFLPVCGHARQAHRAARRRPGRELRDHLRRRHRALRHAHPHAGRAAGRRSPTRSRARSTSSTCRPSPRSAASPPRRPSSRRPSTSST